MDAYRDSMREEDFQNAVVDHATANGWYVFFIPDWMYRLALAAAKRRRRPQRQERKWAAKGFPDLVLGYDDGATQRLIVAELKAANGRVRAEQQWWLRLLKRFGVETYVWRPRDYDAILDLLRHPER